MLNHFDDCGLTSIGASIEKMVVTIFDFKTFEIRNIMLNLDF